MAQIQIIEDFHGYEILYDTETAKFFGRKGRRHVRGDDGYRTSQKDIENAIHDANSNDARKKARKDAKPLTFRRWVPGTAEEQEVTLVSYTAQGLRLQRGEDKTRERNNYSGHDLLVIPAGVTAAPLHQAEEALRRAKEQMRQALASCTVKVELKHISGRESADDYHAEEDRVRARIEELNQDQESKP